MVFVCICIRDFSPWHDVTIHDRKILSDSLIPNSCLFDSVTVKDEKPMEDSNDFNGRQLMLTLENYD